MIKGGARLFLATSALAFTQPAQGGETIAYSYDSLGRLTKVSRSGPVTATANYSYDSADNRTNVSVAMSAAPPPTQPPPTQPPPTQPPSSGNAPPTANPDTAYFTIWQSGTVQVLTNDSDPNGHYPLVLRSVSGAPYASVAGSAIRWAGTGRTGTYTLAYVVADSLGATSTGSLTVTVGMN